MTLEQLKEAGNAPAWMTEEAYTTLRNGYLLEGETPRDMYRRVASAAASYYAKEGLSETLERAFFQYVWDNWLCLATPVASNMGTLRGLPISCYGQYVPDSISGIFKAYHETAMLTKNGGGDGAYWGDVRARGTAVGGNGNSEGIVPWLRVWEQTLQSVSQGGVRRGSGAGYLPIDHGDIDEFLDIRRPTGDISRRCLSTNFHHAVIINDEFMQKAIEGDPKSRELWAKVLKTRLETGEPYLMFSDNANRSLPAGYVERGFKVKASQLCVSGDTKISISSDDFGILDIEIQDLLPYLKKHADLKVYSMDPETGAREFKKITAFAQTSPKAKVLKITDEETGKSITCTPEHKVFTKNRGYVMAKDLLPEDVLVIE